MSEGTVHGGGRLICTAYFLSRCELYLEEMTRFEYLDDITIIRLSLVASAEFNSIQRRRIRADLFNEYTLIVRIQGDQHWAEISVLESTKERDTYLPYLE